MALLSATLVLTEDHRRELKDHLFADGDECGAVIICGHRKGDRALRLTSHSVTLVSRDEFSRRTKDSLSWRMEILRQQCDLAREKGMSILVMHSHPGGFEGFSIQDNEADLDLLPSLNDWLEGGIAASAVMTPDGSLVARYWTGESLASFDRLAVVGHDLSFTFAANLTDYVPADAISAAAVFGARTTNLLRRLSVGFVGASGTGSPTIAQFAHYGVGEAVLVDFDTLEKRNLNRVLFATAADIGRLKVDVVADGIERLGLGTRVVRIPHGVHERKAIEALAQCDVIFGCVDSADARYLINRIGTFYSIPVIDLGVAIPVEKGPMGVPTIISVGGRIRYLRPGGASLLSAREITKKKISDDAMRRQNPALYKDQLARGYIDGVVAPTVLTLNMATSAFAVNDFLSRLHAFRQIENRDVARTVFSFSDAIVEMTAEEAPCAALSPHVGRGDCEPLLGMAEFS